MLRYLAVAVLAAVLLLVLAMTHVVTGVGVVQCAIAAALAVAVTWIPFPRWWVPAAVALGCAVLALLLVKTGMAAMLLWLLCVACVAAVVMGRVMPAPKHA